MSETSQQTTVTATPTVTIDPSKPATAAPAAAPAAPAPPANTEPNEKPSWLDARLERERRAMLKELGVENVDDAKKAIADLKAKEDAEKTAAQKATEAETALKAERAKSEEMAKALGSYAKAKMQSLTEAQRAAVAAVAGEDAAKQLATIEALTPTWAGAAPAASTTQQQTTPTTAPTTSARPADTAPAPSAPKDGPATSPPDHKAVHAELAKNNPVLAARYALAHGVFDTK